MKPTLNRQLPRECFRFTHGPYDLLLIYPLIDFPSLMYLLRRSWFHTRFSLECPQTHHLFLNRLPFPSRYLHYSRALPLRIRRVLNGPLAKDTLSIWMLALTCIQMPVMSHGKYSKSSSAIQSVLPDPVPKALSSYVSSSTNFMNRATDHNFVEFSQYSPTIAHVQHPNCEITQSPHLSRLPSTSRLAFIDPSYLHRLPPP